MNHIYKSIFNKALGVFTAVPEFASAHGKGSERTVVGRVAKGAAGFAASALAISIGLALTSTSAVAYPGIYINDRQAGNCLAINDTAVANLGVGTILDVNSTPGSVELKVPGTYAPQTGITPSYYNAAGSARPCAAIGNSTVDNRETQTNRTLFYGGPGAATEADEVNNENNGAKNLTLGGRLDVNSGIIGVGDRGTNGAGATNSIRMGMGTALSDANKQVDAITIGVNAGASAKHATAIGSATTAKTGYSTALGYKAQAGDPAVTLLNGEYATAIGGVAKALNAQTTAVGAESVAAGVGQTSIGAYAGKNGTGDQVAQSYGVFIGRFAGSDNQNPNAATEGGNNYGISIGESAGRYGQGGTRNTAIGEQAGQYLKGSYNIAMGSNAGSGTAAETLEVTNTAAIGNTAKALTEDSIAIGRETESGKVDRFDGKKSIAIGTKAKALGTETIAIGALSSATNGHNTIALGAYAHASAEKAISIGAFNTASGVQSIVIAGNYDTGTGSNRSTATAARAIVMGVESHATAADTLTIGSKNKVASARTYAIGNNIDVKAGADDSLVFGTRASVAGVNTIAMGNTTQASANYAIAVGNTAQATAEHATAIGNKSVASNVSAIALGRQAQATDENAVALGADSKADGHSSFAGAVGASSAGTRQVSIGHYAGNNTQGSSTPAKPADYAVFIGNYAGSDAAGTNGNTNGVAIGSEAGRYLQSGSNNTAIGSQAGQYVEGSLNSSLGQGAGKYVKGDNNIAMGTQAGTGTAAEKLEVSNTTSIGNAAKALTDDSISIGRDSKAGKVDKFDGKKSIAIGYASEAMGSNTIALGSNAATNNGHDSIAMGTYAKTNGEKTISIGAYNTAEGAQSIVIAGNYDASTGSNRSTTTAAAKRAIVVGPESHATAEDAVAIGNKNTVASARTYALGNNINVAAGADDSLAFGTRAAVGAANTVAIGANANAAQANSVALGAGSTTSAANTTGPYTLNSSYTAAGLPNAANGTVSVGAAGKERQIQNVAAGVISATSTDAINGSQLYATNNYMNNFAGDVKTKLGGNAALGNDGHLTMTNIGGTGKDNVNDAIAAANTKVVAGDNITVTPTTNADGSKTYTVATTKDLVVNSVQAGDTTVNTDGVTITGGPSVKKDGINAGDKKITNVAPGAVTAGSKDAVNGGQLAEVKAKADSAVQNVVSTNPTALTATKAGDTVTLTPNVIAGDLVNPATGAVNTPAAGDAGKLVTAGTVANALANTHFVVDTAKTDGELDAASKHDQKIKSGNKVTLQAGKNLKAKQTNAADGATVEFSLKDSISLTQVTAGTGDNQVVLGNNGVQVGGNTYINKDGLNANNKPISNVADGVKPKDAVNKGQLDAVAQEAAKHTTVKAGKNVEVTESNNAAGGKEYTVKTADNLNVTSVKAGDTTVNTDGVTITGGPSVKKDGINAGNKKITDVADGNVAPGSKDAVNGGQLAEVKAKADSAVQEVVSANPTALTATKAGDTVTLTPNFIAGDLVNADGTVNDPAATDEGKLVSAKTVADALKANHFVVDTKANGGKVETGSEADAKVGSGNKVTFEAGKNLVAKQANTANGGATVKFSLQDDISLNSVTAGTGDNQVVLGNDGVKVGGKTYINNDGLNANDKKITNVAPGAVTPTSKDAVNGGQLYDVAKNVADLVGPDAKIDPATGKVSVADPTQGIGGTGKDNIGDAIKAVNATAAKHTTVVEGKNVKVTKGKNAAGGDEYTVATKDDLEVTSVTAGNTTVNTNGLTITGGPSVTRGGIDAGNRIISGVKAGDVSATSQEAVNGSQLHATNTKLDGVKAKADTAVQDVKSGDENALTAVKDPNTNIVTVTPKLSGDLVDADGNITAPATPADKGKLVTAGTVAQALANTHFVVDTKATDGELDGASQADQKIKAGNKVTLQAGKNLKAKQTNGANGAEVEFSLKDSISLTQVTAGDSTLNTDGLTIAGGPSVKKDGIDAGDKKITNVAPGAVTPTSKDAVNGSQLYNVADNVKDLIGPDATIDPATGKVTVADPTQGIAGTGKGTIGEAIKSVKDKADTAVQDIKSGDEKALSVTKAGNTYTITPNLSGDLVDADGNITAPATDADKGKLVTAGTVAQALANTHFVVDTKATDGELDGASEADQKIKAGNKVTLQAGKNLKAKQTNGANGAQVEFSLKDSISLKEVTAGDSTLNTDGLTIAGGPSVKKDGINAGNKKITGVANGNVAAGSTDAVNGGQLAEVKSKADSAVQNVVSTNPTALTATKVGDTVRLTPNFIAGDLVNPTTGEVNTPAAGDEGKLVSAKTVADALKANHFVVDTKANGGKVETGSEADAKVGSGNKVTFEAGKNLVAKQANTANGGATVKFSLQDDISLNSVTAGTGDNQVVLGNDGVKVGGKTYINNDGLNANDKKITNVAPGAVTPTSKDAVNGSQLYNVANNVKDLIGPDAAIDPATGKVTVADPAKGIAGTGKGTIGEAIQSAAAAANTKVAAGDNITVTSIDNSDGSKTYTVATKKDLVVDSVKAGDTTVDKDGLTIAGGPSVKKDGINAGGKKITNVADGVNPNDAVNKGQLDKVAGLAGSAVQDIKSGDEKALSVTKAGNTYTITPNLIGELVDADGNITPLTPEGKGKLVTAGTVAQALENTHFLVNTVATAGGELDAASQADQKIKAGNKVTFQAGKNLKAKQTNGANGTEVEFSLQDNVTVKTVNTDNVKANNGIEIVDGPSMTKDGINAAGKAISNVANGNVAKGSKDAVNGGQLHETAQSVADVIGGGATVKDGKVVAGKNGIGNTGQNTVHGAIAAINQNTANNFNQIRGDLRKMDRDLRGGIAGALATAGLPQAFRPGKSMVAAAASTYRGQSGLAIGVSRISDNGKVILKVTGNTNSRGDFGGTIGAGYQW